MPNALPRLSTRAFGETPAVLDYLLFSVGVGFIQVGISLDRDDDHHLSRICARRLATRRIQLDVDDIGRLEWSGPPEPFEPVRVRLDYLRDGGLIRLVMRGRLMLLSVEARTCTISRSLYDQCRPKL